MRFGPDSLQFSTNVISCEVLTRTNIERCGAVPATQTTSSRGTKILVQCWQRYHTLPQTVANIFRALCWRHITIWFGSTRTFPNDDLSLSSSFFLKSVLSLISAGKDVEIIWLHFAANQTDSSMFSVLARGPGLGLVPCSILSALGEPRTSNIFFLQTLGVQEEIGKKKHDVPYPNQKRKKTYVFNIHRFIILTPTVKENGDISGFLGSYSPHNSVVECVFAMMVQALSLLTTKFVGEKEAFQCSAVSTKP